ncbi:hypothetical protein ACH5RR_026420 [Cinchona calisaya]|uniref:DUF4218 domain-containing protein n=1 Tax=Cinchona calisaya TaxID=153742 RepID=A0ABD2Z2I1_9GENT
MQLNLKKELHLKQNRDSFTMPMACYHLTKEEKRKVLQFMTSIKFPDGFASNVSRYIKGEEFQLSGMKSHDFYVFIQRILTIAIRGCLTKEVRQVLFELSEFFKKLCSKTSFLDVLQEEERNIALILCKLELIFPPSFFDIMIHLMVHLPYE